MGYRRVATTVYVLVFKGVILSVAKDPEEFHTTHTLPGFRYRMLQVQSYLDESDFGVPELSDFGSATTIPK